MNEEKLILISYSSKDFETAYSIAQILKANGFTIWMAPESIPGASDYLSEINKAIKKSSIVLFLLSPNSLTSEWCPKEVESGITYHKSVIPYQIQEGQVTKDNFELMFRGLQIIDGFHNGETALNYLLERISQLLDIQRKEDTTILPPVNPLQFSNVKLARKLPDMHAFFGSTRDQEIEKLKENFNDHQFIAITGIGGFGKSELAKGFAHKMLEDNIFKNVHFLTFKGNLKDTIKSIEFENFDESKITSAEALFTKKLEFLNNEPEDTLLIIDNYDEKITDLDKYLSNIKFKVLFTTRYTGQTIPKLPLGKIPIEKEEELFILNRYQFFDDLDFDEPLDYVDDEERENIKKIINIVDHHPLALELIAKAMSESEIEYEDLIQKLNTVGFKTEIEEEVETTYNNLEEGQIDDLIMSLFSDRDFSEEEKTILRILSLAPVEGLDAKKIKDFTEQKNLNLINRLVKRSWIIKERKKGSIFKLHPLIQKVIYSSLEPNLNNTANFYKNIAAEGFKQLTDKVPYLERQTISQMINNASYSINDLDNADLDLIVKFIYSLYQSNYFDNAKKLLALLEKVREQAYLINPTLENLYNLNEVYIVQARIEYQLQKYKDIEKSLALFDKVNYENYDLKDQKYLFQVIDAMSYKGWALYLNRQSVEANKLFEKEEKLFDYKDYISDIKTFELKKANYLYNYSVTLYNVRDLKKAAEKVTEAIELYRRYYRPDHPEITSALNELGFIELANGNIPKAYDLFRQVLEIRKVNLGLTHMHTATAYNNVAIAALQFYTVTGDKKYLLEAKDLIEKALKIRTVVLPETPLYGATLLDQVKVDINFLKDNKYDYDLRSKITDTLETAKDLCFKFDRDKSDFLEVEGDYYYAIDFKDDAINAYEKSLDIRKNILNTNHEKYLSLNQKLNYIKSL